MVDVACEGVRRAVATVGQLDGDGQSPGVSRYYLEQGSAAVGLEGSRMWHCTVGICSRHGYPSEGHRERSIVPAKSDQNGLISRCCYYADVDVFGRRLDAEHRSTPARGMLGINLWEAIALLSRSTGGRG